LKISKVILIFFFTLIYSSFSYSNEIVVVDIEKIINNNSYYKEFLKKVENDQKSYLQIFNLEDKILEEMLIEIENSKLLLEQDEINVMIDQYNDKIQKQNEIVNQFNNHYQNEIIKTRKKIFNEIIILLEKYAFDNKIELILDSTNYLIASNAINITNIIEKQINLINLNLEIDSFE
tara:strand:+ start:69 stop:599 length:531 start_codon:yes stop_codon:yes gene_type:complete